MSRAQYQTGNVILQAVTTPVSITTLYAMTTDLPAVPTWGTSPVNGASASGTPVLHMFVEWDGTGGARYTVDGTTTPDDNTGFLVPHVGATGTAGTSSEIVLTDQAAITNLQIIAIGGASDTVTWYIEIADDRT